MWEWEAEHILHRDARVSTRQVNGGVYDARLYCGWFGAIRADIKAAV